MDTRPVIFRTNGQSRKTLYLHIGHYKTGTTALQLLLEANRKVLRRQGLDYLEYGCFYSKHSRFAFSLLKAAGVKSLMHGYSNPMTPEQLWTEMLEAVRSSPADNCLISTEEFIRLGAYPEAVKRLAKVARLARDVEIRVVVYLRQPQAHLQSWYNQLIKMNEPVLGFEETVGGIMEEVHFDYGQALRPWIDIFGADALIVRPYAEGSRMSNALYADFLSIFGIDLNKMQLAYPEEDPNPRLSADRAQLGRMIGSAGLPPRAANTSRIRAEKFLDRQASMMPRAPLPASEISSRCAAGLDLMRKLPGNGVDVDMFRQALPDLGDPAPEDARQLASFLMSEVHALRQRLFEVEKTLGERIAILEQKAGQDEQEKS